MRDDMETNSQKGVLLTPQILLEEWPHCPKKHKFLFIKSKAFLGQSSKSLKKGRGMEFLESRPYVPSDETRHIDWRVSARLGTTHTKIFIEERQHPAFILLDLTSSMGFGSKKQFKSVLACRLLSLIGRFTEQNLDEVHGLIMTNDGLKHIKAKGQKSSLSSLLSLAAEENNQLVLKQKKSVDSCHASAGWHPHGTPAYAGVTNQIEYCRTARSALNYIKKHLVQGSFIYILSDLYWLNDDLKPLFFSLKKRAHIYPIRILDPMEKQLKDVGVFSLAFQDKKILVNSSNKNTLENYEEMLAKKNNYINDFFFELNIDVKSIFTDDDAHEFIRRA